MPDAPASTAAPIAAQVDQLLQRLGVPKSAYADGELAVRSPISGETIALARQTSSEEAKAAIGRAHAAYLAWRLVPAPRRGELVRLLGEELRAAKADLGPLVTLEAGKVPSEGAGRSAGDDRHLRLRRRPVAPALRPDHRHRAPRAPDDGDLAPAGRGRRDLRLQLPGGRLVVERGAGARRAATRWCGSPPRRPR